MNFIRFLVVALLLIPSGCQKKTPEPPPSPPRVERPVLTLEVKPEALIIHIPREALVERGGIPGVFVLDDNGEARFRLVRAGRSRGAYVEIVSGLHGRETLVLGDLAAVHDGSPVTVLGR